MERTRRPAARAPGRAGPDLPARLRALTESRWFQWVSTGVIVFNAVLIGAETFGSVHARFGDTLLALDSGCLVFFIIEVLLRIGGHGRHPWRYFRHGWNVFDFAVVAAALVPGLRENVTLLRVLRLARVVRIVRAFPQLRILLSAVWRSLPGVAGLLGIAAVVLYLYGMVGWMLFGQQQPDQYGSIGDSVLTLFMLMTMDNVSITIRAGMEITPLAVPYYVSFILLVGLVLINLLIGVVITSMEDARDLERDTADGRQSTKDDSRPALSGAEATAILDRLDALQRTVNELSAARTGTRRKRRRR